MLKVFRGAGNRAHSVGDDGTAHYPLVRAFIGIEERLAVAVIAASTLANDQRRGELASEAA
jgi:hypothetical protein